MVWVNVRKTEPQGRHDARRAAALCSPLKGPPSDIVTRAAANPATVGTLRVPAAGSQGWIGAASSGARSGCAPAQRRCTPRRWSRLRIPPWERSVNSAISKGPASVVFRHDEGLEVGKQRGVRPAGGGAREARKRLQLRPGRVGHPGDLHRLLPRGGIGRPRVGLLGRSNAHLTPPGTAGRAFTGSAVASVRPVSTNGQLLARALAQRGWQRLDTSLGSYAYCVTKGTNDRESAWRRR